MTVLCAHHDGSSLYFRDERDSSCRIKVRLRVHGALLSALSISVRVVLDGEPRFVPLAKMAGRAGVDWWEASVDAVSGSRVTYRFFIIDGAGSAQWFTARGMTTFEPRDIDDFLVGGAPAPRWARAAVMYQIFPDRFARGTQVAPGLPSWAQRAEWDDDVDLTSRGSRQVYGGDLYGIIDRLEHIESLGVGTIYLNPFFPARSNHRYDASTFDSVDELLGGNAALSSLVAAAHERGVHVIGDLTANHTGDEHEWFIESRVADSSTSDFYIWRDREANDYESWYGVPTLPKLDWRSQGLRRRFVDGADSVVAKWLRAPYNLDGWRIDVANMSGRHGPVDLNHELQHLIRHTMASVNDDAVLLAESTNDLPADFAVDGWHGAITYTTFTRPLWAWLRPTDGNIFGTPYAAAPKLDAAGFVKHWRRFTAGWSWNSLASSLLAIDTHDTPRFARGTNHAEHLMAALLASTLPGIPLVYAGDEFAVTGESGEAGRVPMPWPAPQHAPLLEHYRALGNLRRTSTALTDGGLRWLSAGADHLVYEREDENERVVVAVATAPVTAELEYAPGQLYPVMGEGSVLVRGDRLHISFDRPGFLVARGDSQALPWASNEAVA